MPRNNARLDQDRSADVEEYYPQSIEPEDNDELTAGDGLDEIQETIATNVLFPDLGPVSSVSIS
jgi:hypothetical protein